MVFRTLIVGTLIFGLGAFYALRNDSQARTFFVVIYAIFAQDRELLFDSPTIDDAAEEIVRRHTGGDAIPAPDIEGSAPAVRDFTRRDTPASDLPPTPRFGN